MILWFYRLAVAPLATLALPFLALFNKKVRDGLKARMQLQKPSRFSQKPLWIHAASGEFEYAKPVIRELKKRHPELPIVVTYFSPTYAKSVQNFPGVDLSVPLPLDLPGPCLSFIKRLQPCALLIARTDFWPELLHQTRQHGIPIRVFSYTQRPPKWPLLTRWRLSLTDAIECVSQQDKMEVTRLASPTPVWVGGDTRYDQVGFRLAHPKELPSQLKPALPCLVAGSTWSEDEAALLPATQKALLEGKLQLILVPHEPTAEHISTLQKQLARLGLNYSLFSQQEAWADKHVLLVDKVGVLAELYAWGTWAFVGGSFRKTVHSVMEALGAGCITFVGPKYINNREAIEFSQLKLQGIPGLHVANSTEDLKVQLEQVLTISDLDRRSFQEALKNEFQSRQGATMKLVENLSPLLP